MQDPYPLLFAVRDTLMTMTEDSLSMRDYSLLAHAIVDADPTIDGFSPKAVHRVLATLVDA